METVAASKDTDRGKINSVVHAGILVIVALLPFHAFLRTWLASLLTGSTVDQLTSGASVIASWKEFVLIILLALVLARAIRERKFPFRLRAADWLIGALALYGLLTVFIHHTPALQWIFGMRTDFGFFALYFLARSVPWNTKRLRTVLTVLITSGVLVVTFGMLLKFILPHDFLLSFGYSPYTSSYVDTKPLPMYHCEFLNPEIGGTCIPRIASTLSGPNQYGTYLLVLIALLAAFLVYGRKETDDDKSLLASVTQKTGFTATMLVACVVSIYFTYSQAAWGSLVILAGILALSLIQHARLFVRDGMIVFALIGITAFGFRMFGFRIFDRVFSLFPNDPSSVGHVSSFLEGAASLLLHPFGVGVGNAGPVSERFFGDQQGIIAESWYIQIAQEMGIIGGLAFTAIIVLLIASCWRAARSSETPLKRTISLAALLALSAVSIDAIVLHAWADVTTSWIVFCLVGIAVSAVEPEKPKITSVLLSKGVAAFGGGMNQSAKR